MIPVRITSLLLLLSWVFQALDDWKDIGETVDDLEDAPQFRQLKFYDAWHRRNINRVYPQLEAIE